jgi:nucleoside diphosphate kinase
VTSSKEATCRMNRAFVFLKPNAIVPQAITRVKTKLSQVGIEVVEEGSVDAIEIDHNEFLDNHYGAIAAKAMNFNANTFNVSESGAASFSMVFGAKFEDEVKKGNVVSAKIACSKLGISQIELGEKWNSLKFGESIAKLGGGFYCGLVDGVFVINGFYMAMRALYVTPPASIVWMCVEWPESQLRYYCYSCPPHTHP